MRVSSVSSTSCYISHSAWNTINVENTYETGKKMNEANGWIMNRINEEIKMVLKV